MFGHSNDTNSSVPTASSDAPAAAPGVAPADMSGFTLPSMQNEPSTPAPSPTDAPTVATPAPTVTPTTGPSTDLSALGDSDTSAAATTATPAAGSADLLDIKQQALQHLSPLLGHLDQSPEEKFRTTMMMIQAADDQTLIKSAYEAAQAISDEKTRAQALLDIVNEINYFTQQHNS